VVIAPVRLEVPAYVGVNLGVGLVTEAFEAFVVVVDDAVGAVRDGLFGEGFDVVSDDDGDDFLGLAAPSPP